MAKQDDTQMSDDNTLVEAVPEYGYWRGLAELDGNGAINTADAPNEFPKESGPDNDGPNPLSRRNFMQVMGASLALAGAAGAGCKRYEKDYIVPLARRPEDQVPGNAEQFASSFELAGVAQALLVTAYEGRPIKVDGNPEHPFASGGVLPGTRRHAGSSTFAQASLLSLYDPDRSQAVMSAGSPSSLNAFKVWLAEFREKAAGGGRVRVLSEASSSPTLVSLRSQLAKAMPGLTWHEWESVSWDNEREGLRQAFGRPLRAIAKLDAAETIVTIDCDIFSDHPASLRYARDYGRSRRADGGSLGNGRMNRLWSIESIFSATGGSADHRLPLRAAQMMPLLQALEGAIAGGSVANAEFLGDAKVKKFVEVLGEELRANRGRAVLVTGSRQPAAVHALVARLNDAVGAVGRTLEYIEDPEPLRPSHAASIAELARAITDKRVDTLLILGGNPVYDAPADLKFAELLKTVTNTVHLSETPNETSELATWHIPRAHALETWADARTWDGTITIGQPLIMPFYGGISSVEFVSLLLGNESTGDVLVRDGFNLLQPNAGDVGWKKAVHDGFVAETALPSANVGSPAPVQPTTDTAAQTKSVLANGSLEVVFASGATFDGRYANNAWLQETPDFLTKVTWDNYALVSPATATEFGLKNDTIINVEIDGRSLDVACYTMPGQARYSIGLVLGGGRTKAGKVGGDGKHQVGFDVGKLRTLAGLGFATGAKVTATGRSYTLANTQEHWDFRAGIDPKMAEKGIAKRLPTLIREVETSDYADKAWRAETATGFYKEDKRGLSLYQEKAYTGHQWGMATDLSSCIGCNSCIVACTAENNIPMVGKEQVINNREMQWIRIDRYFSGPIDDPEIATQPVACQQCENAPCEQVCPVAATAHSDEGLNDMSYNRCVGTRYCANNCPYKVRRFNFFDYHKEFEDARNKVRKLLFNPEVTVRSRGVMEKCTFCVQRIQNAKISAKRDSRTLTDGEITTACQDACPTEAIVFGDLADKNSRVSKLHKERRAYGLLDDVLYTKPRNQYMARVRNPHPKLAKPKAAAHGAGHDAAASNTAHEGGH